ncbi:MAG TPA: SelL-related redox protein [Bryobacteraceae bacterium]|nr:SelL-related redox protein [Bryobacteraceae bacterium]
MKRWITAVLAAAAGSQVIVAGAILGGSTAKPAAIASAAAIAAAVGWAWPVAGRRRAVEAEEIVRAAAAQPGRAALAIVRTPEGESLADLSDRGPALLVFVRHAGCCFCREAISDLAAARPRLEAAGICTVIVHRSSDQGMRRILERYKIRNVALVRDSGGRLYRAFGLRRGTSAQIVGPALWGRGIQAALLEGHGVAAPESDPWQMPGVFLVHRGRILSRFYHRSSADRPDYAAVCASGLQALRQAG